MRAIMAARAKREKIVGMVWASLAFGDAMMQFQGDAPRAALLACVMLASKDNRPQTPPLMPNIGDFRPIPDPGQIIQAAMKSQSLADFV